MTAKFWELMNYFSPQNQGVQQSSKGWIKGNYMETQLSKMYITKAKILKLSLSPKEQADSSWILYTNGPGRQTE